MKTQQERSLRLIEGRQVSVALRDGTRIDDCSLVSSGRNQVENLWLFIHGEDVFIPTSDVVDVWVTDTSRPRAA